MKFIIKNLSVHLERTVCNLTLVSSKNYIFIELIPTTSFLVLTLFKDVMSISSNFSSVLKYVQNSKQKSSNYILLLKLEKINNYSNTKIMNIMENLEQLIKLKNFNFKPKYT